MLETTLHQNGTDPLAFSPVARRYRIGTLWTAGAALGNAFSRLTFLHDPDPLSAAILGVLSVVVVRAAVESSRIGSTLVRARGLVAIEVLVANVMIVVAAAGGPDVGWLFGVPIITCGLVLPAVVGILDRESSRGTKRA